MKLRKLGRLVLVGVLGAVLILAIGLTTVLTVDLGPSVRALAEREGSKRIERPMHIGRLSIHLLRGQVIVEDLVIEGLTPADRPFLRAGRIAVSLAWGPLWNREVFIESVEMTDWDMTVETFAGGRHSFPRLARQGSGGPKRFVTTVQHVRAHRGQFTFEDHGTPWSTVARNLDVTVVKAPDYRGHARFSDGTVQIQSFLPMSADMEADFTLDGPLVRLSRIDLETDGAHSLVSGVVDLANWPEQTYQVRSHVELPRMREIFFSGDDFSLSGEAGFQGRFHLFKGGRDLRGDFSSELAGLNEFRFPNLRGSLVWLPDRFEVTRAQADFYGGAADFTYVMAPLGSPEPTIARFDASYQAVELAELGEVFDIEGIGVRGRASGRNVLEWPLGSFSQHRGEGLVEVSAPEGARVLPAVSGEDLARIGESIPPEMGPFWPYQRLMALPIAGAIAYRFDPTWIEFEPSWVAAPHTRVRFEGRTAFGDRSRIRFHVTSADWQESDRILAGIMTAVGSSTSTVPIGGYGEFDGVMLGAFRDARVEGRFEGRRMRAWGVVWGETVASVVIENAYAEVRDAVIRHGDSEIRAEGRLSIGFPRRDGGEEIDVRVDLARRPVADLRHAFGLDDYPVDGLASGEFHVYGRYQAPFGFGRVVLEDVVAYGEPLARASAGVRLEGEGVRFDGLEIQKDTGRITGAAYVGFDGTYSFNADGRRVPVESLAQAQLAGATLSGLLQFSATGGGRFDRPEYEVRGGVSDLFIADEGIGQVSGRVVVRGRLMTLELEAASPRLSVTGSGRVALTPQADAELTFRFTDTSLDPYVRAFEPRLSPFTTAVASGALRIVGELADYRHLLVDATIEHVGLTLFDYGVTNDAPIRLALDRGRVVLGDFRLVGEGTRLGLEGEVGLADESIDLTASGDANLGILQGFFRDVRASGDASLSARIRGSLRAPVFSGSATVTQGRLRHFGLPHSLEGIDGRIAFDANSVRFDELRARLGGGDVRFGGRIGLEGYVPAEFDVTAFGEGMHLRYPEGVRSIVDADLALRGAFESPLLAGSVTVRDAVWSKRFDPSGSALFGLGGDTPAPAAAPAALESEQTLPVRFDLQILAPSTLRIENNAARIVASAELSLRGTYDRPQLFGHAEVERGEVLFEGNRYFVTRGTIDFANPARIEPFFDIEAETRVRVPGETYRVVFHVSGTTERFVPDLSSDPPLPVVDILSLLFGDPRDPRNADLRALQSPDIVEQELIQTRAARLLASPISSGVGRVVEETFGVDSVQIVPSLTDPSTQQSSRLNPTARLTIGKRISDRVYLTFSRALSATTRDQIILLEYDQTDRLAWIVSQNEDSSYALDFRVRHSF